MRRWLLPLVAAAALAVAGYSWALWHEVIVWGNWPALLRRLGPALAAIPTSQLNVGAALLGLALVIGAFAAAGAGVARLFGLSPMPVAQRLLLGEWVWALLSALFGPVHLLEGWLLALLVGVGAAATALSLYRRRAAGLKIPKGSVENWFAAVLTGVPLLLVLAHPTTFYDALVYHLALPKQYVLHGSIAPLPWHVYSHFPSYGEMLYLLADSVGGQLCAQLLNLWHWFLGVLLLRDVGHALGGAAVARTTTWLAWLNGVAWLAATLVGVDLLLLLVSAAALANLVALLDPEPSDAAPCSPLLYRCALFAGFACGIKYTAFLYVAASLGLILAAHWRRLRALVGVRALARSAIAFALPACVWPLRNMLATGNPLYPMPLVGQSLPAVNYAALQSDAHAVTFGWEALLDLVTLPWTAVFASFSDLEIRLGSGAIAGTSLYVGLLGLLVVHSTHRRLVLVAGYAALSLVAWALTFRMLRFALPAFAAVIPLAGYGLAEALANRRWLRWVMLTALIMTAALTAGMMWRTSARQTHGYAALVHDLDLGQYLELQSSRHVVELGSFRAQRALASASGTVLTIGEPAVLYLSRPAVAPTWLDVNPLPAMMRSVSPEDAAAWLRQTGVSHILFRPEEYTRLTRALAVPLPSASEVLEYLGGMGTPVLVLTSPDVWVLSTGAM